MKRGGVSPYPADQLRDLVQSMVRRIVAVATFAVVAGAVVGVSFDLPEVFPWLIVAAAAGLAGAAMLATGWHRPDLIVVGCAIGAAIAARSGPTAIVFGWVSGVLVAGVPIVLATRVRVKGLLYTLILSLAVAMWWGYDSLLGVFGLLALLAGSYLAMSLLAGVIDAARSTEERYRVLVESASDAIIAVDEHSRIILFNEEACRMFGYSADEVIGEPLEMLMPKRFHQTHAGHVERFANSGRGPKRMVDKKLDMRAVRINGEEFPVDVAVSEATAAGGTMFIAFVKDVSERHRQKAAIRERERRYRELFDHVPAGLYRTTPDGRIIDANKAFVSMLGYRSKEELLKLTVADLYGDPSDRDALLAEADKNPGMTETELRLLRADGSIIRVKDRTVPVFDASGNVVSYEGDLRDVTEERRAEAELRALVESKSELIAAVSHELRTPLTAVVGFLDLLDGDSGLSRPERDELVHMAFDQATDMSALVEDLLTAARIESDDLVISVQSVDAADLVHGVAATVASAAVVQVDVQEGCEVMADPVRLRQILRNLISNALRHGASPVRVEYTCACDGTASISVIDSGRGVAEETTDRIFDAFFRGQEATSLPGSVGIGLTVSRRLAQLMGGELSYERRHGETWFTVELPISAVAPGEAA